GRATAVALPRAFTATGLAVLGPTKAHLHAAAAEVLSAQIAALAAADAALRSDATGDPVNVLRRLLLQVPATDAMTDALVDAQARNGAAVNCQSTVVTVKAGKWH